MNFYKPHKSLLFSRTRDGRAALPQQQAQLPRLPAATLKTQLCPHGHPSGTQS